MSSVTNGIKDLLEQNEKRFVSQQSSQEGLAKLLDDLKEKYESLESRCQEYENDNANLKLELQQFKKSEKDTAKEIVKLNSELQQSKDDFNRKYDSLDSRCQELETSNANLRLELQESKKRGDESDIDFRKLKLDFKNHQAEMKDFEKWVEVVTSIATQITSINQSRENFDERLQELDFKLNETAKQVRRCQQQFTNSTQYRTPVKSPSTSSYFSNIQHNSLPRHQSKSQIFHRDRSLLESSDPDEELEALSLHADHLKSEVEMINDLQRSFEKSSSIYSND